MVYFYLCCPSWDAVQGDGVLEGAVKLSFAVPRGNIW